MAPSFNVVVKPNDWAKTGQQNAKVAATMTPTKQRQLKFWTDWTAWLQAKGSSLKTQKPLPQHWTNIALGRSGVQLCRILHIRPDSSLDVDAHWPIYFTWLEDVGLRMKAVFGPLVKELS